MPRSMFFARNAGLTVYACVSINVVSLFSSFLPHVFYATGNTSRVKKGITLRAIQPLSMKMSSNTIVHAKTAPTVDPYDVTLKVTHPIERISKLIFSTTGSVSISSDASVYGKISTRSSQSRHSRCVCATMVLEKIAAEMYPRECGILRVVRYFRGCHVAQLLLPIKGNAMPQTR